MIEDFNKLDIQKIIELTQEFEEGEEEKSLKKLLNVKHKIKIFKNIDTFEIKALVYSLKFVRYEKKEFIINDKEESSYIYFILEGECQVLKQNKKIGTLHAGDTFGEIGVIFREKRSADVICSSDEAIMLKFKLDQENLDFNAQALAKMYKNLANQIKIKLEELNKAYIKR
jgi:CRP-like cAMP-binding protein